MWAASPAATMAQPWMPLRLLVAGAVLCYHGAMSETVRVLGPADQAACDALLAAWPLGAVYARSHLRNLGLGGALRGYGIGPLGGALAAALLARDGIGWAAWSAPNHAAALAGGLLPLGVTLLSGPRALVEPILAHVDPPTRDGGDYCPFQRCIPADLVARPPDGPPARAATAADIEPLINFYLEGFYSLTQLPTRAAWHTRLSEQLAQRTLFLIEQDGVVLSAAQSSAETPAAAMIGGVATTAAARRRGLSARCVHALCSALFARGVGEIGLFYLPANLPAARLYARLGFRPAGEWWLERLW